MSKQINNLNNSLEEQLHLNEKQDKTDNNLETTDKTIVGAINELFQSANNGKELIASAIGEPLSSEDTFSAMSNNINNLLSTFKTNMMNNGITVGSGDKFKTLIDKIATMVEEGSGKGIQFASGNVTSTSSTTVYATSNVHLTNGYTIEVNNLTFKPYIVILTYGSATLKKINACAIHIDDATNKYLLSTDSVGTSTNTWGQYTLTPVYTGNKPHTIAGMRDNGFLLYSGLRSTEFTYYAIGVGEEDTTLKDSLASILTEEGVNVTEEDDMASLISKVDQEFDRQVVPQGTAVASNVLSGKTFINNTGQVVTGAMANKGAKTFTPSASKQTGAAGYYSSVTCNAVSNLTAANIKSGVTVGGVTGTCIAAPTSMLGSWYHTGFMYRTTTKPQTTTITHNKGNTNYSIVISSYGQMHSSSSSYNYLSSNSFVDGSTTTKTITFNNTVATYTITVTKNANTIDLSFKTTAGYGVDVHVFIGIL